MLMRTLNWLHGGHKPCDNLWCSRYLLLLLRLLLNTWEIFVVYKNQKKAGTRRHRRDRKCGIPSIRLVFRNDNESRRTWCNRIAYNEVIFPLHTRARLEHKLTSELANANSNRAHSNQLKRSSKLAHVMAADCVRYKLGLLQLNKFRFHRDPPSWSRCSIGECSEWSRTHCCRRRKNEVRMHRSRPSSSVEAKQKRGKNHFSFLFLIRKWIIGEQI